LGGLAKHFKANEVYQGRRCFEMQICSEAELEQKKFAYSHSHVGQISALLAK
jgi:DUF1009 family protein